MPESSSNCDHIKDLNTDQQKLPQNRSCSGTWQTRTLLFGCACLYAALLGGYCHNEPLRVGEQEWPAIPPPVAFPKDRAPLPGYILMAFGTQYWSGLRGVGPCDQKVTLAVEKDTSSSWTTLKTGTTDARTPVLSQQPNLPHHIYWATAHGSCQGTSRTLVKETIWEQRSLTLSEKEICSWYHSKHLFGTQTPPSTPQRTQAAQQGGISAPQSCHSSKPHDGVMWHVPSPASLKGRGITNKATVHICIKSQHKHALMTAR